MKMSVNRIVTRPADQVFAYFSDAAKNPEWQQGMVSCVWTTEAPIGLSSTYEQHARFAGRDVISTFEVTAFEAGQMIEITTLKSTFPIKVVRTVTQLDETSCEIQADISGGPERGFLKLIEPLMATQALKSINKDYDRLVDLLQASASTDSTENSPVK
jgi:hypothetical protein